MEKDASLGDRHNTIVSLITEQQTYEHNPMYDCMQALRSQTIGHSTITPPLSTGASIEHTRA